MIAAGTVFDRLTVIAVDRVGSYGHYYYLCQCQCGKKKSIAGRHLTSGNTRSCRCLNSEMASKRYKQIGRNSQRHGRSNTPEHRSWSHMLQRCNNSNNKAYWDYGGRGIKVFPAWMDFEVFLKDMGEKPGPKYSLDRINNEGNYEPGNCRWATKKEQANNRRKRRVYKWH